MRLQTSVILMDVRPRSSGSGTYGRRKRRRRTAYRAARRPGAQSVSAPKWCPLPPHRAVSYTAHSVCQTRSRMVTEYAIMGSVITHLFPSDGFGKLNWELLLRGEAAGSGA